MGALCSCIYKDIKLFLRGAGVLALILPLLLLPVMKYAAADLDAGLVESFPIAVRDLDGTLMSRSLISQLRKVELFSEVCVLEEGETDAEAIAGGAAAVATIPEDFFFDLYDMAECPVDVTLSTDDRLDSALFESIFTSVMGIIRANHASALGVYTFVYGELDDNLIRRLRAETGDRLVLDALGRQRVFDAPAAVSDAAGALTRRLSAGVLSVLALFFALTGAKNLPEERRLGVIPRFRAAGGAAWPFLVSKLLTVWLLSLPALALTSLLAGVGFLYVLPLYSLLLAAAFALTVFLSSVCRDAARTQRLGGAAILLSLALGGTLYPALSPALARLTLPGAASQALEAVAAGLPLGRTLALLWPIYVRIALFTALSILPVRHWAARILAPAHRRGTASGPEDASPRRSGFFARTAGLSAFRLRQLTGGPGAAAVLAAAALICGLAASARPESAGKLRLAVQDLDESPESRELLEYLSSAGGLDIREMNEADARLALIRGEREGLLTVGEGYAEALNGDRDIPLRYDAAASALSGQGAREIVAGHVVAQLRRAQSVNDAGTLLGRELTDAEISRLFELTDRLGAQLPDLYRISYSGGEPAADPFSPSPMSFALLTALFALLTAAAPLGSAESRAVRVRMGSIPRGKAMELASSLVSLTALGYALTALALLPSGSGADSYIAAIPAAFCFAALSLLLARRAGGEGRVDALAPLAALLICLLGGCFMDLSSLSPAAARLTLLSPAGLAFAARSSPPCALALLLEGAAFTALAARGK